MVICMLTAIRLLLTFVFFFSSRRRHTISLRDWSSDVCSSDLQRRSLPADLPAVIVAGHWKRLEFLTDALRRLGSFPRFSIVLQFQRSLSARCQDPFFTGASRRLCRSEERRVGMCLAFGGH